MKNIKINVILLDGAYTICILYYPFQVCCRSEISLVSYKGERYGLISSSNKNSLSQQVFILKFIKGCFALSLPGVFPSILFTKNLPVSAYEILSR